MPIPTQEDLFDINASFKHACEGKKVVQKHILLSSTVEKHLTC